MNNQKSSELGRFLAHFIHIYKEPILCSVKKTNKTSEINEHEFNKNKGKKK